MPFKKQKLRSAQRDTNELSRIQLSRLLESLSSGQAEFNSQEQCPLFNIPAEIRNNIFAYVIAEQDGATAIATTDYYYRPDFTHFRYVETALLRTCRRIWLETHALPRQQITRRYWAGDGDRRPTRLSYAAKEAARAQLVRQTMKSRSILPCETAEIFIQMFALERSYDLNNILRSAEGSIPTRHLIITLRYTDWWFWENNTPLSIKSNWTRSAKLPDSLEKLTMELETRQGNKGEMDAIVSRQVSKWEFCTISKKELRLSSSSPRSKSYIGTDRPGGQTQQHHKVEYNQPPTGMRAPLDGEMYYYAVTLDFVPSA